MQAWSPITDVTIRWQMIKMQCMNIYMHDPQNSLTNAWTPLYEKYVSLEYFNLYLIVLWDLPSYIYNFCTTLFIYIIDNLKSLVRLWDLEQKYMWPYSLININMHNYLWWNNQTDDKRVHLYLYAFYLYWPFLSMYIVYMYWKRDISHTHDNISHTHDNNYKYIPHVPISYCPRHADKHTYIQICLQWG